MNEPPNEKDAQRGNSERLDEATHVTSPSTWFETDLGQNIGTLFVAAIIWVATFIH